MSVRPLHKPGNVHEWSPRGKPRNQCENGDAQAASSAALLCRPADLAALLPDLSGRLLINSVFHMGAERLQQMLFSDSPFLQGFLEQCKFTGQAEVRWAQGGPGEDELRRAVLRRFSVAGCGT